ncbi:MAG: hypothetical protein ACI8RU_001497, partial [Zhongshania aliphaticivorans]
LATAIALTITTKATTTVMDLARNKPYSSRNSKKVLPERF